VLLPPPGPVTSQASVDYRHTYYAALCFDRLSVFLLRGYAMLLCLHEQPLSNIMAPLLDLGARTCRRSPTRPSSISIACPPYISSPRSDPIPIPMASAQRAGTVGAEWRRASSSSTPLHSVVLIMRRRQ
jgi:hypothetical protein